MFKMFASGFVTCIKTILPIASTRTCSCILVSVSVSRFWCVVWFSCNQGWRWIVHITVMSCSWNSCWQTSVKLLTTYFPVYHMCTRALELSCCDTRLSTSHIWPQTSIYRLQDIDRQSLSVQASNAMHGQNTNLPVCVCLCVCVCPSHFLSTRLQVRPLNGFLQLIA